MKKVFLVLTLLVMSLVFVACDEPNGGTDDVRIYLWNGDGVYPTGFQEVVDTFNNGAGQELGVKLDFKFDTLDDYKTQLNLTMSANQDNYDVVFDAGWIYLNDFANKGYYYDLTSYFNNNNYPGLKKAFQPDFIENNLWNSGVYGIPLTETFGEIAVTYIRKDWRVEAANDTTWTQPEGVAVGVTEANLQNGIDSFEELEYYLYWVRDNKEGITPALSNSDATWGAWDIIDGHLIPAKSAADHVNAGIKTDIVIKPGVTASAYIRNSEVMAVHIGNYLNPNVADGLSEFPAGFNTGDDSWQTKYLIAKRWADDEIISKDVLTTNDSDAQFRAGNGGVVVQSIGQFASVEQALKQNVPGAELEIFVHNRALREKKTGYAQTDYKAWNFLSIPKTVSEAKKEKIMKFFDWLFKEEENHDLFQYGIKGKHWDEAKDEQGNAIPGTVTTVGKETYTFTPYVLTWNPNYIRVKYESDPKVLEYSQYMYDINRYTGILYSGFQFNTLATPQLSNALNNPIFASSMTATTRYYLGQIDNPVASWNNELNSRYSDNALQSDLIIIQQAIMEQLQAYIDSLE